MNIKVREWKQLTPEQKQNMLKQAVYKAVPMHD